MGREEKERLAEAYAAATAKFAQTVSELRKNIGTSPRPEYERLQRLSVEARLKSEEARLELERHLRLLQHNPQEECCNGADHEHREHPVSTIS